MWLRAACAAPGGGCGWEICMPLTREAQKFVEVQYATSGGYAEAVSPKQ